MRYIIHVLYVKAQEIKMADVRGVLRGICTQCRCPGFTPSNTSTKCGSCSHPPGKHVNLSSKPSHSPQVQAQADVARFSNPGIGGGRASYAQVTSTVPSQLVHNAPPLPSPYSTHGPVHGGDVVSRHKYYAPTRKQCRVITCHRPCHYDPDVGEFDYCSPACRDKDLLEEDRANLAKHLRDKFKTPFHGSIVQQTAISSRFSPGGDTSHIVPQTPEHSHGDTTLATSSRKTQKTYQVDVDKEFNKELGLIISEKEYQQGSITGVLVLGFEYGTKAESLFESEDIHPLDVIVYINERRATSPVYAEQNIRGLVRLEINRKISLPGVKSLIQKEKSLGTNGTHLLTVFDPEYSAETNGYGLEVKAPMDVHVQVTLQPAYGTVISVSENTPARRSHLRFEDKICAISFFPRDRRNPRVESARYVSMTLLEKAAKAGEIPVLVIKRQYRNTAV